MLSASWHDFGREPQNRPDPRYPNGVDLDTSKGAARTCTATLHYPARRCGMWVISCSTCGLTATCTTAGRSDDPRSIKLACRIDG